MQLSLEPLRLLAQRNPVDSVVNNLRHGLRERTGDAVSQDTIKIVLLVAAALLALWGLSRLGRHLAGRCRQTRLWLFWSLCRAHQLPWRDRWLLWQAACEQTLADPALVFVCPEVLSTALAGGLRPQAAARLKSMRSRLFVPAPEEAPAVVETLLTVPEPARPPEPPAAASRALPAPVVPILDEPHPGLQIRQPDTEPLPVPPLLPRTPKPALDVGPWLPTPQAQQT